MKMNRILAAAVPAAVVAWLALNALSQQEIKPTQAFMRQKMGYSQAILEGLTLEHFDQVSKNAVRLRDMMLTNTFLIMRTPGYLQQITNFHKSADALFFAATEQDLRKATDAYAQVMRSCVECHQHFRLEQRAKRLQQENRPR